MVCIVLIIIEIEASFRFLLALIGLLRSCFSGVEMGCRWLWVRISPSGCFLRFCCCREIRLWLKKKRDPVKRCLATLSGWTFDLLTDCPQDIWRRICVLFCGTFVPILNSRWTRGAELFRSMHLTDGTKVARADFTRTRSAAILLPVPLNSIVVCNSSIIYFFGHGAGDVCFALRRLSAWRKASDVFALFLCRLKWSWTY